MIYPHVLTGRVPLLPMTTALRSKRARLTHVILGVATAVLCIGPVSLASAQTYRHDDQARMRDYMAQTYPGGFGPPSGTWRYALAAHRPNARAYPMTESSGPATATGGPSGGIN